MNCDLSDMDKKKFDMEFEKMEEAMEKAKEGQRLAEIAMNAASGTREHHRRLATSFDEAEVAMSEWFC